MNLQSYREETKSNPHEEADEDDETKVIRFSEPNRLMESSSDLHISVLSRDSCLLDREGKNFVVSALEKTNKINLASLIPTETIIDRKNHSETFYANGLFKKLLEEGPKSSSAPSKKSQSQRSHKSQEISASQSQKSSVKTVEEVKSKNQEKISEPKENIFEYQLNNSEESSGDLKEEIQKLKQDMKEIQQE